MQKFGVCECGAWGEAPREFDERIHFLKCPKCEQFMFLITEHPLIAGYRFSAEVAVSFAKHNQKI